MAGIVVAAGVGACVIGAGDGACAVGAGDGACAVGAGGGVFVVVGAGDGACVVGGGGGGCGVVGAGGVASVVTRDDDCEEKRREMREASRRKTSATVRDGNPCNCEHGLCRCTMASLLLPRPVKIQYI